MFTASLFLILLIVVTPITILIDGSIVQGLVIAAAAAAVAIVALRIRPGEIGFLSTVIRRTIIIATVLALWMLIQVLPLKLAGIANPIWESAAMALGRPLAGSISIDPGATLISLARCLATIAIVFVAAAVAVDRRRAEWILLALTAATMIIALIILVAHFGKFAAQSNGDLGNAAATDSAALGMIVAIAALLHTIERARTQSSDHARLHTGLWLTGSLIAFSICGLAVFVDAAVGTYFALACGIAIIAAAIVARRTQLGAWGYTAIVAVTLVVGIAVFALQPRSQKLDVTLAFATKAPAPLVALTERILTETGWLGTGAGTFAAVLPNYRDVDELAAGSIAPTAAAAIAVEMGRPFLWTLLAATLALVIALFRGAVRRGRDSFYSIAGAATVVTIMLLAFTNIGLFGTPVLLMAATTVGIALAQSRSRSA